MNTGFSIITASAAPGAGQGIAYDGNGLWVPSAMHYDVKTIGKAKGDTATATCAITSGSAVATGTGTAFASTDVGKSFIFPGAGASGTSLVTTIASVQSATQVTLAASAGTTVASAGCLYGTDDTASIQATIDAIPAAGILFFPAGYFLFSNFDTRGKSLVIQGVGWAASNGGLPGNATWQALGTMSGSVLISKATSGNAINFPQYFAISHAMRDIALIGQNAAGVIGIQFDWLVDVRNILVANFATGVQVTVNTDDQLFDSMWIRGCGVGLNMSGTNNHQFNLLKITYCSVNAIAMTFCWGNTFICPLIEANNCPTMILLQDDGNSAHGCIGNVFSNIWSENPTGPTGFKLLDVGASSKNNQFGPIILAYNDAIHIAGPNNTIGPVTVVPPIGVGTITVDSTATGTTIVQPSGPVTGTGSAAISVSPVSGAFYYARAMGIKCDGATNDAPALNAALAAIAAAGGGTLLMPVGTCKCLSQILVPDKIRIVGQHRFQSVISFPTDLGTGPSGTVSGIKGTGGGGQYAAQMENLAVWGPGGGSLGVPGNYTNGIEPGPAMSLTNVSVYYCYAGVAIRWDHNFFRDCLFSANYFGAWFADNPTTGGNHLWYGGSLVGNNFASVCVEGDNQITGVIFDGTHLGFGPYGFYKRDVLPSSVTDAAMTVGSAVLSSSSNAFNSGMVGQHIRVVGAGVTGVPDLVTTVSSFTDANHVTLSAVAGATVANTLAIYSATSATAGMLNDVSFRNVSWESIGNAAVYDVSTGAALTIYGSRFEYVGFLFSSQFQLANQPFDWTFKTKGVNGLYILSGVDPFVAANVGAFYASQGDFDITFDGSSGIPANFFGSGTTWCNVGDSCVVRGTNWKAICYQTPNACTAGDIMEFTGGTNQLNRFGTSTRVYAGVALNTLPANTLFGVVITAVQGAVNVNSEPVGHAGIPVSPYTGLARIAPIPSTPDSYPVIGVSMYSGGQSGGGATTPIDLRPPTPQPGGAWLAASNTFTGAPQILSYTDTLSTGTSYGWKITPTHNETGTAGSTDFLINRTEPGLGSGTHNFIDCQIGGVSKAFIDRTGLGSLSAINLGKAATTDGQINLATNLGLVIANGSTSTFRLLSSGSDCYFENTAATGNLRFTGPFGGTLTGTSFFSCSSGVEIDHTASVGLVLNQGTAATQSNIYLQDRGTTKWQIGKQTDNGFYIYDDANGKYAIVASAAGIVTVGEAAQHVQVSTPNAAPSDPNLANSQIDFYLDEVGNNLKVRVKYSSGTLKTGTIALV